MYPWGYALIREIMEDTLPLSFDEWERNAECERETAKREGTIIIPVFIDPDEFFSFCKRRKIPLNKTMRAGFANSRGADTPWGCEVSHARRAFGMCGQGFCLCAQLSLCLGISVSLLKAHGE